jgi:hypothetical protein
MKKLNISDWAFNLMIAILTATAMFLIAITFTGGKEEGKLVKVKHEQSR